MTSSDTSSLGQPDPQNVPLVPLPPVTNGPPPPVGKILPLDLQKQLAQEAQQSGRSGGFHRRRNKRYWMK